MKIRAKSFAQRKRYFENLEIRLEIRLEINFCFILWSSVRLCIISLNLLNIHFNLLDISLYIDTAAFGRLDLPLSPWFLQTNQIDSSKSDFNYIYLTLSSINQINSIKSEFNWLLFGLIFFPSLRQTCKIRH